MSLSDDSRAAGGGGGQPGTGTIPAEALDRALRAAFLREQRAALPLSQTGALAGMTDGQAGVRRHDAPLQASAGQQRPPERIGRYEVLGEVAHGGLGVILRSRDTDLGREVALKVLLERHAGSAAMTRRLLEEAQICGQLQHPGIVPVYEMGLHGDLRPWFSMKLVEGHALSELLAARPDPAADRPRFLAVFEQVCHTVAYAHARGVVHRDLKPANVMVGSFGEVQVVDWGLAKVIGAATGPGSASAGDAGRAPTDTSSTVAGTPAYMAPEQARGAGERIDARSDVFGLGAILCEILTGRPPFGGATPESTRRSAAAAGIGEAMARLEASGADRELIDLARRCLAAEPPDRPQDAGQVAAEMSAYRAAVESRARAAERAAVEARAQAAEERAQALAAREAFESERRRRRRLLQASAATLLVLAGAAGVLRWVEADRRERADRTRQAVEAALARATLQWGEARSAPAHAPKLWADALAAAREAEALAATGDAAAATRDRVGSVLRELVAAEALARSEAERVELERSTLERLEAIRIDRGDTWYHEIEPHEIEYRRAFRALGIDVIRDEPGVAAEKIRASRIADDVVAALDDWMRMLRRRRVVGYADWRKLAQIADLVDADARRKQLRVAWIGRDVSALRALAQSADLHAWPAVTLGQLGHALGDCGDAAAAVDLLRRAQRLRPGDFWITHDLGANLGQLRPVPIEERMRAVTVALALRPKSYHAWIDLGAAWHDQKDWPNAIAALREAVRIAPRPICYFRLGRTLLASGDADGAIAAVRECLRQHPSLADGHSLLAEALLAKSDLDGAIVASRAALAIHPRLASAHANLGVALRERDVRAAVESLRQAVALAPDDASIWSNLGALLDTMGERQESLAALERACALKPDFAPAWTNLGVTKLGLGDVDGAIAAYREALRLDPADYETMHNLGNALQKQSDLDGALVAYRDALRLRPDYFQAHVGIRQVLEARRDLDAALAAAREATQQLPRSAWAQGFLGEVCFLRGDLPAAEACFLEAVRLEHAPAQLANLGMLRRKQGRMDEAVLVLEEALGMEPESVDALSQLAEVRLAQGRAKDAVALLERAAANKRSVAAVRTRLGFARRKSGDLEGAVQTLREAVRMDPKQPTAWWELGLALRAKGDRGRAVQALRRAVELAPDDAGVRRDLGAVLYELGDLDASIAASHEALRLRPEDGQVCFNLGAALELAGNYQEAAAAYRRGVTAGNAEQCAEPLSECERMAALVRRLPGFLAGSDRPADAREALGVARLCAQRQSFEAAAGFYEASFAAAAPEPASSQDHPWHQAACTAAPCGFGSADVGELPAGPKAAHWRAKTIEWLRRDLADCQRWLATSPPEQASWVRQFLASWSQNPRLAGIWNETRRARLSVAEQAACESLLAEWQRVRRGER